MKFVFELLLTGLLPGLFLYVGKDDYLWESLQGNGILNEKFDYSGYQFWLFIFGLLITSLALPIRFIRLQKSHKDNKSLLKGLVRTNRDSRLKLMKHELGIQNVDIKTRIFRPTKSYFPMEQYLTLKYYEGLSDSHHARSLQFRSGDQSEGLVGKAFNTKTMVIDFDLSDQNSYHLTESQKTKIGDLKFCVAVPIFNRRERKVKAIVTLDSPSEIRLEPQKQKELIQHIRYYVAFIDKHLN